MLCLVYNTTHTVPPPMRHTQDVKLVPIAEQNRTLEISGSAHDLVLDEQLPMTRQSRCSQSPAFEKLYAPAAGTASSVHMACVGPAGRRFTWDRATSAWRPISRSSALPARGAVMDFVVVGGDGGGSGHQMTSAKPTASHGRTSGM